MQKLAKFSSNPGTVHFEGLVQLLRYMSDNKNLGLKHYNDMKDAPLSELLIQDSINTENQFMAFSNSSLQYCPDTERSTGSYIIFYQGRPIHHDTHVPVPVAH